jgi:hypothetical protein
MDRAAEIAAYLGRLFLCLNFVLRTGFCEHFTMTGKRSRNGVIMAVLRGARAERWAENSVLASLETSTEPLACYMPVVSSPALCDAGLLSAHPSAE